MSEELRPELDRGIHSVNPSMEKGILRRQHLNHMCIQMDANELSVDSDEFTPVETFFTLEFIPPPRLTLPVWLTFLCCSLFCYRSSALVQARCDPSRHYCTLAAQVEAAGEAAALASAAQRPAAR